MSAKSPGQKAYEADAKFYGRRVDAYTWENLDEHYRLRWETIAAAVTAPELPSYGKIAEDAFVHAMQAPGSGRNLAYETAALAVIAEAKRRGELP